MSETTILIIEDDPLNRKLLRTLLTLGSYRVLEAADAESGIRIAREAIPQCILMDIQLPGMDGLAATRVLKGDPALKAVPIVAVTAFAMKGDERKALDSGCDGYITKPIDTRVFLDSIRQFLTRTVAAAADNPRVPGTRPRVLIADDEPPVVRLFASILRMAGYDVREAGSGEEALAKGLSESPDLILLDVRMPDLDGYEITRRLKANLRTMPIPIILMTGLADQETRVKGLEAGADEFLAKPVDSVELLVRMKSMIRLKQYQEQISRHMAEGEPLGSAARRGAPETQPSRGPVVLIAETDDGIAGRAGDAVQSGAERILRARTVEETLSLATRDGVDVLLLGGIAPSSEITSVCRVLKREEATRSVQIIVLSRSADPETKIAAFEQGADDHLTVPFDGRELGVRVRLHARKKAYLDGLHSRYRSALNAAASDGLTSLYNNTAFKRLLELELKRSHRHAEPGALLLLDIDDFKQKNDTLGHLGGDLLLNELAGVLRQGIRDIDIAGRYGGEEFAVLLPHTDRAGAEVVAERLRATVEAHRFLEDGSPAAVKVTISVGGASFPADASSSADLIRAADARLYAAKRQGKNRCCLREGNGAP